MSSSKSFIARVYETPQKEHREGNCESSLSDLTLSTFTLSVNEIPSMIFCMYGSKSNSNHAQTYEKNMRVYTN